MENYGKRLAFEGIMQAYTTDSTVVSLYIWSCSVQTEIFRGFLETEIYRRF